MFTDWLDSRGGDGSIEIKNAIKRIELLLATNEFSDRIYHLADGDDNKVHNLLADRKSVSGDYSETEEFWVLPSVFDCVIIMLRFTRFTAQNTPVKRKVWAITLW